MNLNFQYYYSDQYQSRAEVLKHSILKFYEKANINAIDIGSVKDGYVPNLAKESLQQCLNRLEEGWDHVVSIGADCELFSRLEEVEELIKISNVNVILVPHVYKPVESRDYMAQLYRTGHANGDFKVFTNNEKTKEILRWLISVTEGEELSKGIFHEQTWLSALPFLYPGIQIIQHPGYNVGYWDINERNPSQNRVGEWMVAPWTPIRFMHYSGMAKEILPKISKYSDKIATGDILKLYKEYDDKI